MFYWQVQKIHPPIRIILIIYKHNKINATGTIIIVKKANNSNASSFILIFFTSAII